ncbi:hypothetical protein BU26DRAFT_148478 [Trematosphaeria pertusa]|uniref:Uncharacterized protein n=1 Tax=Trematosphaeria pertusa TaxID=390896 RepID=A0A6A6IZB8_9PLEO|nr:uncharacterized protein BU26DRAFT_148478 [Trematosphaeria pertusa]KAF2254960.1 hypothetical protein BU26DRAFT_148478 [Trematosphaeria pertusa]
MRRIERGRPVRRRQTYLRTCETISSYIPPSATISPPPYDKVSSHPCEPSNIPSSLSSSGGSAPQIYPSPPHSLPTYSPPPFPRPPTDHHAPIYSPTRPSQHTHTHTPTPSAQLGYVSGSGRGGPRRMTSRRSFLFGSD